MKDSLRDATAKGTIQRSDSDEGLLEWANTDIPAPRRRARKAYVHLRSQLQKQESRGFIFPQNTPRDLGMVPGTDNSELTLILLPLKRSDWPKCMKTRMKNALLPSTTNMKGSTAPIHSLTSSSDDEPAMDASPATPSKRKTASISPDSEEDRKRRGVIRVIGMGPEVEEEANALPNLPKRKHKHSEMPIRQLAKAWVEVEVSPGKRRKVLAALDSQSNATFISRTVGQSRKWDEGETSEVRGFGDKVNTKAAKAYIYANGEKVELRGRFEPGVEFDDPDTHLLLGADDCRELRIDLNHAIDNLDHQPAKYRAPLKRLEEERAPTPPKSSKYLEHLEARTCRLSEKMMAEYMAATGGTSKQPKQVSPDNVLIGEALSPAQKKRVKQLVTQKFRHVFMTSPDDIPPALPGVATAHKMEVKRRRHPNPVQKAKLGTCTK